MTYRLTRFGTVTLPAGAPRTPIKTGPSVDALVPLPGGGVYDGSGGGRAALRLPYDLVLRVTATATSTVALETTLLALRGLRGARAKLWRTLATDETQWCYARLLELPGERGASNILHQPVELRWLALSEWRGARHSAGWDLDAGVLLDDGYYLDEDDVYTLSSSPYAITVANANAVIRGVRMTVRAGGAAITALTIRNTTSGCCLTFTGTVAAGDDLVIDAGAQAVTNDGVGAYADLSRDPTYHQNGAWFELWAGDNSVTVTLTGGSTDSTITFEYYEGYE
jgi:hypothetical protein